MRDIHDLVEQRLASINNVKDVKNAKDVKDAKNVNNDKDEKDEKNAKQLQLARLKAMTPNSTARTSSSPLGKPIDEEELLDSSSEVEGLCDGPLKNNWARFRAHLFLQESRRGEEWKLKLLMTTETDERVELMATLGRKWDFLRGMPRDVVNNDPWYAQVANHIDSMQKQDRCGKFYLANTKTNNKKRRNTITEAYTAVILTQQEKGVYTAQLWLWNGHWNLTFTDTFLTDAQKRKNMLADTQWFNADSSVNHKEKTALDIIGWNKQ